MRVEPHGNQWICDLLRWTHAGTNGFLGPQSGQGLESPYLRALILMGNWCNSGYGVDTATTENSDAVEVSSLEGSMKFKRERAKTNEEETCAHLTGVC